MDFRGNESNIHNIKDKTNQRVGWGLILVSGFILICLFARSTFFAFEGVAYFFNGLFGLVSYPLFLATGIYGGFLISDRKLVIAKKKFVLLMVGVLAFVLLVHIASTFWLLNNTENTLIDYLYRTYNMQYSMGGGTFGLLSYGIVKLISPVFSIVVMGIVFLGCMYVFSDYGKSIKLGNFRFWKKKVKAEHIPFVKGTVDQAQRVMPQVPNSLFVEEIIKTPNNRMLPDSRNQFISDKFLPIQIQKETNMALPTPAYVEQQQDPQYNYYDAYAPYYEAEQAQLQNVNAHSNQAQFIPSNPIYETPDPKEHAKALLFGNPDSLNKTNSIYNTVSSKGSSSYHTVGSKSSTSGLYGKNPNSNYNIYNSTSNLHNTSTSKVSKSARAATPPLKTFEFPQSPPLFENSRPGEIINGDAISGAEYDKNGKSKSKKGSKSDYDEIDEYVAANHNRSPIINGDQFNKPKDNNEDVLNSIELYKKAEKTKQPPIIRASEFETSSKKQTESEKNRSSVLDNLSTRRANANSISNSSTNTNSNSNSSNSSQAPIASSLSDLESINKVADKLFGNSDADNSTDTVKSSYKYSDKNTESKSTKSNKVDLSDISEVLSSQNKTTSTKKSETIKNYSIDDITLFENDLDNTASQSSDGEYESEDTIEHIVDTDYADDSENSEFVVDNVDNTGYYTYNHSDQDTAAVLETPVDVNKDIKLENKPTTNGKVQIDDPSTKPKKPAKSKKYVRPHLALLQNNSTDPLENGADSQLKGEILINTLSSFGLDATIKEIAHGPAVTRFAIELPSGVPVKSIEKYATDLAYNLESNGSIRLEMPIPGKKAIGIEVPNLKIGIVGLKEIIESKEFKNSASPLTIALGKDISGQMIIASLDKMPHLLIAGATGSGKSACINSIITSILYKASPEEVRLILIDPKRVELSVYSNLPHLIVKDIVTEPVQAVNSLNWAINEMERRYKLLDSHRVRNIGEFNNSNAVLEGEETKLPFIVIIVDELADLMMANKRDIEDKIRALTQKARAAGIHLIVATQRPSVDVITGTIKANLPSRIAFSVTNYQDSRTILDTGGAEALLGRGDMLYSPLDANTPRRVQGAYITSEEVLAVVDYCKDNNVAKFDDTIEKEIMYVKEQHVVDPDEIDDFDTDPLLKDVCRLIIETNNASATMIQRKFRVGYARASRIIDQLEERGYIGPLDISSRQREVRITREVYERDFGEPL